MALDDIDFEDELRIVLEERASLSPDALTGMEANHRFVGPETIETKIFGRLTAWQNWIFNRPNASGPDGALRRFGTGQRGDYDARAGLMARQARPEFNAARLPGPRTCRGRRGDARRRCAAARGR